MSWWILAFTSVLLFSLSLRCLSREWLQPTSFERLQDYSAKALRVEKGYKIMAWGILSVFLFYSMVMSFIMSWQINF